MLVDCSLGNLQHVWIDHHGVSVVVLKDILIELNLYWFGCQTANLKLFTVDWLSFLLVDEVD